MSAARSEIAGSPARHSGKAGARPRLRVVTPPRSRRLPFLIASFLIVGILVVGVASVQAVVSQGSFHMQELTRRNVELQQQYGRLKLQVAELSSPGRIASEARRLGFRVPKDVRTLPVKGITTLNAGTSTSDRPVLSLNDALGLRP
jgi:cell division protein FtsL